MIEVNNLYKQFGKLPVLNNVNIRFDKGNCIALIGPNGCGKTTLIKSILGMVIPTKGEILFNNSRIQNTHQYRHQIGYMPQIGRYPENMTIGQVIDTIKTLRNSKNNEDNFLYDAFKLSSLAHKKMRTLSGGTTQKISATIAFMFNPSVLILDEPTAGLDPIASEILKEKIIIEKNKGKLILITSHILSELDELINKVVFMQDGIIKFNNTIEEIKTTTNEISLAKAIAKILKSTNNE